MAKLNLSANIDNADSFYAELLAAHSDMDKAQSDAFNARLILVLANHVGDREVLREALDVAQKTGSK